MRILVCTLLLIIFTSRIFSQTISGPSGFCEGSSITLTVTGANATAKFQWQRTPDGTNWTDIGGATSISYNVNIAGAYRVLVDNTPTPPVDVKANPKPIPDFTFTNNNACSGSTVQFTSSVTSGTGPYTYSWNFEDGGTSTLQDPTHIFTSLGCNIGTFNVTLTVTDANGCVNTVVKTVSVKQAPDVDIKDQNVFAPFSNCDKNPTPGNAKYTLTVLNNSASASCITSYSVNWGDGSPLQSNISFPLSHTYTEIGAYNLVVTASGTNGCSNSKTYVVANQSNPAGSLGTLGSTTGLCAPANVPFTISNWQLNSAGTSYRLNFGDGTITTFQHPLNAELTEATVNHIYTTSSCPNSPTFVAILQVVNACATTPYTAGNIQIRIKPGAAFTTPASGCAGKSLCFTNTTATGYSGSSCSATSIYEWDFGDGVKETSTSPCHTFSTPGTYKVTLTATNPCGTTTFTKDVCIVPAPVSSFTLDAATGCGPLSVTVTNTSNTLTGCTPATNQWTVSYNAAGCGTTSSWSFTNNTTSSSVSPSFVFTNPGTYTITHSLTNGCTTSSSNKTITVHKPPTVVLANISNSCTPIINPSATVTNCGTGNLTYAWSFPGGNPSTSTSASPGQIDFSVAGTYTISLTVTNECGSTTATRQITINETPAAPSAQSNSPLCSGSALQLTSTSTTTGVTYAWTGPSGFTSTLQNPVRSNATTGMSGNYTVKTSLNGCSSTATTVSVVVDATPSNPVATSPVTYCQNAPASPLTANSSAGNSLSWYTAATGGTPLPSAPTPATDAAGTKTYYVSQVSSTGICESGRTPITVNVNAVPVISGSAIDPTNCTSANGRINLSGLSANTSYSLRYSKNNATPVTIQLASDATGVMTLSGLSAGTYSDITVSSNGCLSNAVGPFPLVNPTAPATPTASSNGPLCSGGILKLTSNTASPGVTYSWTGPGGFNSVLQNPEVTNVTTSMSGNYTVIATSSGCSSAPTTVNVVINQTPVTPAVVSPVSYCKDAPAQALTATPSAGNNLKWYSDATGGTPLSGAPIPTTATAGNVTYYVSQVNATSSCESERTGIAVNIFPVPAIQGSFTDPTSCISSNGTINISGIAPNTNYTVKYSKNGGTPITATLNGGSTSAITLTNLSAGTYSDITVTLNGCISNAIGPYTLTNPAAPVTPTATSNSPLCSGSTLQLRSNSTSVGATYTWTGPGGFTSVQQNADRANGTTAMSGTYSVTATLNGCTSSAGLVEVVINQTPAAPASPLPTTYCQNTSAVPLTISPSAGNAIHWYAAEVGGTALQAAPTPITSIPGNFTYYASQFNTSSLCESGRTPITVIVKPVPVLSGNYTNPTSCSAPDGGIDLSGLIPNTLYTIQYTKDGGTQASVNLTSSSAGGLTISNLSAGTYSNISVILNGCTSNSIGPFVLSNPLPPPAPSVGSNSPLCAGSILNLNSATYFPR